MSRVTRARPNALVVVGIDDAVCSALLATTAAICNYFDNYRPQRLPKRIVNSSGPMFMPFAYREPDKSRLFSLIEEMEKVNRDLIACDEDGKVTTVR